MKDLYIITDKDHSCVFEFYNPQRLCNKPAIAKVGNKGNEYVCREHAKHYKQNSGCIIYFKKDKNTFTICKTIEKGLKLME